MTRLHTPLLRAVLLACVVLFLAACPGRVDDEEQPKIKSSNCTAENSSKPRWIYQADPHNKIAVVFVHGIIGDTVGSWTNASCHTFFQYLHDTPGIGDKVDVYAFGFDSPMLAEGAMTIGEAAVKLDNYLEYAGIMDYDRIVFVAHSMGGLITMREISSRPEVSAKTPLIVFYATPHEGSQITEFARYLVDNKAIKEMLPYDGNSYLQALNEDWVQVKKRAPRPTTVCAYEKKATYKTTVIVPPASASKNCDEIAAAIDGADHISIVKPNAIDDLAVVLLVNAIKNKVLPMMDAVNWDTPDFKQEGDHWTYVLKDINGKNPAAIGNKGQIQQGYTVELVDAADMMMSPEAMPRFVAPGAIDQVRVAVVGEPKPEYRMKLRLGSLPERVVIARFQDLDAAIAQRNERQRVTADAINAYLADSVNNTQFQLLSADQQHERLAEVATLAIARENPDLPQSAQMLVAADTLVSLNQSSSAGAALRRMEERFPASARTQSTQNVAARVKAQTGNTEILRNIDVQAAPLDANAQPLDLSTATEPQKASIATMADHLSAIPSTKSEALVLRGDVLEAQGNQAAATNAYEAASAVRKTPLTQARVERAAAVNP